METLECEFAEFDNLQAFCCNSRRLKHVLLGTCLLSLAGMISILFNRSFFVHDTPAHSLNSLNSLNSLKSPKSQNTHNHQNTLAALRAQHRQQAVKSAFLHGISSPRSHTAWQGYLDYAWKSDELQPLSRSPAPPWFGLGLTAIDALDTSILMELPEITAKIRSFVNLDLSYSHDGLSNVFEVTIRVLGKKGFGLILFRRILVFLPSLPRRALSPKSHRGRRHSHARF